MADKNSIVKWQNSYTTGIKLIDEQHMELIRLTNNLFVACMEGKEKSKNAFLDTVHGVVDYVRYHFSTEEKVMERVDFPEYKKHKQEHTEFVREFFGKVEEFNSGKMMAPLTFVYYLRDWVLHHIAVNDKKIGEYIMTLKKSGEIGKLTT